MPRPPRLLPALVACLALLLGACGGDDDPRDPAVRRAPSPPATAAPRPAAQSIDLRAEPAQILARTPVPILCYHQIRPYRPTDTVVDRAFIMPPATFRAQIDLLARGGYHTVTPDEVLAHLTAGRPLPPRPVMLTFDDAVDDGYTLARPLLRRHRFTATYFVMTVVLDKPDWMTSRQVRTLDREGFTIAAHTYDHHRVDQYAGADWQTQLVAPERQLERIVGHPVRDFAYPYGAWKPDAFAHLRRAGYRSAFQLVDQPQDREHPLLTIRRKIANPAWSLRELERNLRPSGY